MNETHSQLAPNGVPHSSALNHLERSKAAHSFRRRLLAKSRRFGVMPEASNLPAEADSGSPDDVVTALAESASKLAATALGLDEGGYRILANHGANAHQEVPHFHVHIFGGRRLGPMLSGGAMPRG